MMSQSKDGCWMFCLCKGGSLLFLSVGDVVVSLSTACDSSIGLYEKWPWSLLSLSVVFDFLLELIRHTYSDFCLSHAVCVCLCVGSGQQSVTGVENADDGNSYWQIRGKPDRPCQRGVAIKCGQAIRITHMKTGRNLHTHHFTSPLSNNQVEHTLTDFMIFKQYCESVQKQLPNHSVSSRRLAPLERMAKVTTWICGPYSVTVTTGNVTILCVLNTWVLMSIWAWRVSSMATPSEGSVKSMAWDLPTSTTGGAPWRVSSSSPARSRYATMSSDFPKETWNVWITVLQMGWTKCVKDVKYLNVDSYVHMWSTQGVLKQVANLTYPYFMSCSHMIRPLIIQCCKRENAVKIQAG